MEEQTDVIGACYSTEKEAWYVTRNGNKISKPEFPSKEAAIEGYKEYVKVMKKHFPRNIEKPERAFKYLLPDDQENYQERCRREALRLKNMLEEPLTSGAREMIEDHKFWFEIMSQNDQVSEKEASDIACYFYWTKTDFEERAERWK